LAVEVIIQMVENVQVITIQPIINEKIASGTLLYTDEYDIYNALATWGYPHKSVNHSIIGEFARDEGGDGFHEVHVNTLEGFWSAWLLEFRRKNCRRT
jgi:transposase